MAQNEEEPGIYARLSKTIGYDTDSRQSSRRQRRRRPRPYCTCTQAATVCLPCRQIGERRAAAERRRAGGGR